jgi:hypothetical protein
MGHKIECLLGEALGCELTVLFLNLDSQGSAPQISGREERGSASHKGVENKILLDVNAASI